MNNGKEQYFKCKIGYYFYFIKILLIQRKINIEITSTSGLNKENERYINNYSLSHFQEIDPYFKIFDSIKEIYKNIINLINKKKFFINQNEDETLTFILKIKVHDKLQKIHLILTKYYNNGKYNPKKSINENYMDNVSNEIIHLRNKLNNLEQNKYLFSYSNNYMPTKYSDITNNEYPQLQTIISKLNQLENENNSKNKKIKMLENQIKIYQNKNNYNNNKTKEDIEEEDENEEEEKEEESNEQYNDFNDINNNKKKFFMSKNLTLSFNNKKNKINRNNSFDKVNTFNTKLKPKNTYQIKNNNNYFPRDNSVDDRFNKVKTYMNRHNERNILSPNLSMEQVPNDLEKVQTFMPNSKAYKYLNSIPPTKRENIPNLNSKIIFTKKELKLILERIREGEEEIKVSLKLLYRASSDGDFETALKFKCENKLRTLTLFYTVEGARFGFYIEKRIKTTLKSGSKIIEVPGTSFIIGLNNLVYYNVGLKKNSLFEKSDNLLCFGYCSTINNNKTKWLVYTQRNNFINKKFLFGDKNDIYMNLKPSEIIGNNLSYHIKDVEVFEVDMKYIN